MVRSYSPVSRIVGQWGLQPSVGSCSPASSKMSSSGTIGFATEMISQKRVHEQKTWRILSLTRLRGEHRNWLIFLLLQVSILIPKPMMKNSNRILFLLLDLSRYRFVPLQVHQLVEQDLLHSTTCLMYPMIVDIPFMMVLLISIVLVSLLANLESSKDLRMTFRICIFSRSCKTVKFHANLEMVVGISDPNVSSKSYTNVVLPGRKISTLVLAFTWTSNQMLTCKNR